MPIKLVYVTTVTSDIHTLERAAHLIEEEHGPVMQICVRSGGDLDERGLARLADRVRTADLLVFHLMGGKKSLPGFDRLVQAARDAGVALHAQPTSAEVDQELRQLSTVPAGDYLLVQRYINYGGLNNLVNMLRWIANRYDGLDLAAQEPEAVPWEGIYHPRFPAGMTLPDYLSRLQEAPGQAGRPVVGILFYRNQWLDENTGFIDALVASVEKQGAKAIPLFVYATRDVELGSHGLRWVVENMLMQDGRPIVDVVISLLMFSQMMLRSKQPDEPEDEPAEEEENFLTGLGVPVIKAISTTNTREAWSDTLQGLTPGDVCMSVAMPEFDGNLITVPVASREYGEQDPLTGSRAVYYRPIPERVDKVVSLALNWGKLRHKPNAEKRVAIIFHNYPPRNYCIGSAFGLDSPASVWNILRDLQGAGYTLEALPEDGQALMKELLSRLTNDREWASAEQLAGLAVDGVTPGEYGRWFRGFPPGVRSQLTSDWGQAPGEVFNYGDRLLIPGIVNGNIFIGLQPPRGFLEDPSKIYHSPDLAPPHHYLAYYRWIRDDFQADAILHIGKHGTLEWLPGKSVGLSESCYPDLAITDLPHIYPYIINNPGEGTQAKRRSYACIIDHLIPVMTNADAYDELAGLEVQLQEYYQAKEVDPDKLPRLQNLIWEQVCRAHLDSDLELDGEAALEDFDRFLERLHGYLSEVKDTQIRDGLHVFGEAPREERLVTMLAALTRLSNGSIPSLRQGLAEALGHDYDDLLAVRGRLLPELGKTCGQVLDEINDLALAMMRELHRRGLQAGEIPAICQQYLHQCPEPVVATLSYAATILAPKLEGTADELTNTLFALEGGYVPPGPSGAPTRGMADILPTGRNFYSVDPWAIPTRAAWEVGAALGEALLSRYLADKGSYPESVGMVVWGGATMRTNGDDIAEILYLMGVRPRWEEASGRVRGLEVIPRAELGRPRIDVTLRISGFFRDAFPNLVALLDEAVEVVAGLPEGDVDNYLAKHVKAETEQGIAAGMEAQEARELAGYRIFGCRPGAYGAGVSNAIDAKNWDDEQDLGNIYVTWGGYAYGRRSYGKTVPETFRARLSRLDLTVKNEDNREHDMLDSDDFYSYHGGMIAAVKAFRGEAPCSYSGDSSDPFRVRVRSTAEETKHIFRSRVLNPKWIASMRRHGYKGAGDLSRLVDHIFGWDATASVMEGWMYERLAETYALDPAMQEWFREVNPDALQNIAERLLEAVRRGMWQASQEMVSRLEEIYLEVEGVLEDRTDY